jgi:hypothetical protein
MQSAVTRVGPNTDRASRIGETEKPTLNLAVDDLGPIDVLVQETLLKPQRLDSHWDPQSVICHVAKQSSERLRVVLEASCIRRRTSAFYIGGRIVLQRFQTSDSTDQQPHATIRMQG